MVVEVEMLAVEVLPVFMIMGTPGVNLCREQLSDQKHIRI